jgi:DDE superfamily endonuclease
MTIVTDILQQMPAVRQPQRKFLAVLFATILALRGRVTCRNLSRYCNYSERTMARQFRASFDWPDFHQRVLTATLDPCTELISAQDASFIPKSGKQTFGLGHFFNGCANRAERGLEISTLAVVDVTRRCAFTLAVAQTPPSADTATSAQAEEETRIDFYKQQLRDQRQRLPERVTYHCVDGYFAKKKYLDEVVALKLHPITKLRADANCRFLYTGPHPQRRGRKRKYDGKVTFHDLRRFEALGTLEERDYVHLYTALVWHVSLRRKLRVVVLVNRQDPYKPRYIVLASTDLELDGHKLVEFYVARFQIEFLFRDSKQFTGLSDCQARAKAALDFHLNASLATLNLARAEEVRAQTGQSPQVFSMASWKQRQFNERLLDLFIERFALDPTWVKNQPSYDELRTYGAIAA